ncbi:hypothetical protein CGU02_18065 [Vibrio metoecus]|nr:hypothetical protein CGU02_18065 [Vibrio metoecus]
MLTTFQRFHRFLQSPNARLRGWQRITPNLNTTTVTTAAHWDWKRHALTVPLEAFVMPLAHDRCLAARFASKSLDFQQV